MIYKSKYVLALLFYVNYIYKYKCKRFENVNE